MADRAINLDRIRPFLCLPEFPPLVIGVIRAPNAGTLGRTPAVSLKPSLAVPPGHSLFDQRPTIDLPRLPRRLHPDGFIDRDANPDLDPASWANEFALLPSDRLQLEMGRTLPLADALCGEPRHVAESVGRSDACPNDDVLPDIACGHPMDREWQRLLQPVEMLIDRLRLPARVGEDGAVGHGQFAMRRHQRHAG